MTAAIGVYRGPLGKYLPDGTYAGAVGSGITAYESWIQRRMSYVQDYLLDSPSSWPAFENGYIQPALIGGTPQLSNWSAYSFGPRKLMLATCAVAGRSAGTGATTWAGESSGTNDAHWTALGNKLISLGFANAALRIGREWNGGWYPWSPSVTGDNPSQYIAGYSHIVGVLRSCAGANFSFIWNPTLGHVNGVSSSYVDPKVWYPGNAYVDAIGINFYDWYQYSTITAPPYTRIPFEQNNNFNVIENLSPGGLLDWQSFAASKSKPLAFPEYGLQLWLTGGNYLGGGDDVIYLDRMKPYLAASDSYCMWEDMGQGLFDPDSNWRRTATLAVPATRADFLMWLGFSGSSVTPSSAGGALTQRFLISGSAPSSSYASGRMLNEKISVSAWSPSASVASGSLLPSSPYVPPSGGSTDSVTAEWLNSNMVSQGLIPFSTLTAQLYYNQVGSWSMTVPYSDTMWNMVNSGDFIVHVNWRGLFEFGGKCEVPAYSDSIPGAAVSGGGGGSNIPGPVITLSGADYLSLIANRIAFPAPPYLWTDQYPDDQDKIGPVPCETAIKHYVNVNAGPASWDLLPTSAGRKIQLLDMEADAGRGGNVSYNAQFQPGVSLNLMDIIRTLVANGGPMGVTIKRNATAHRLTFSCYVPRDLSKLAWFSEDLGNLTSVSLSLTDPTITDALIRASGGTNVLRRVGDTNAADFEVNTGTWAVGARCTLARSTTNPYKGSGCLRLHCTASGSMYATHCTSATAGTYGLAVSPGDGVIGGLYARAGSSSRIITVGIAFYDPGGTWISTLYGNSARTPDMNTGWTQFTTGEGVTAPDGSAHAILQAEVSAITPTGVAPTNFLTGDSATFENNTGTWGAGGNETPYWGTIAHTGSHSYQMASIAAGNMYGTHCDPSTIATYGMRCAQGDNITASAYLRALTAGRTCYISAAFYNSTGAWISTLQGDSGTFTDNTTGWILAHMGNGPTAPAGAAFVNMQINFNGCAVNESHLIDDVTLFNNGSGVVLVGEEHYFDECFLSKNNPGGAQFAASSGPSSQWSRIESYIDQSSEADPVIINQVGVDALASGIAGAALAVTATDIPFLTFGRDYGLGDKVTVEVRAGDTYTDIVSGVSLTADMSQTPQISVIPVIGYSTNAISSDSSMANQLLVRVRDLERRLDIQGG